MSPKSAPQPPGSEPSANSAFIPSTLIKEHKNLVMVGSGGVGKTTLSASLAIACAEAGHRVGLISIDPAKRLADALGMSLTGALTPIELPDSGRNDAPRGSLHGCMLDSKAVFDDMIRTHASSTEAARVILQHPLYRAASESLSGPLEYMALAKLDQMQRSGRYDRIILDTPPDSQALEFLTRPNILAGFMEQNVTQWLLKPLALMQKSGLAKRFASFGERLLGGVAKVSGLQALAIVAEFFVLMQDVIAGFHTSGMRVSKELKEPHTAFILACVPTQASVTSSLALSKRLDELGFRLEHAFVNKCLPKTLFTPSALKALEDKDEAEPDRPTLHSEHRAEQSLPFSGRRCLMQRYQAERALLNQLIEQAPNLRHLFRLHEEKTALIGLEALQAFARQLSPGQK